MLFNLLHIIIEFYYNLHTFYYLFHILEAMLFDRVYRIWHNTNTLKKLHSLNSVLSSYYVGVQTDQNWISWDTSRRFCCWCDSEEKERLVPTFTFTWVYSMTNQCSRASLSCNILYIGSIRHTKYCLENFTVVGGIVACKN